MEYRLKLLLKTINLVDTAGCNLSWDSDNVEFLRFEPTNVFEMTDAVSIDAKTLGISLNDESAKTGDLHLLTLVFKIDSDSDVNFSVENQIASFEGNEVSSRWVVEPWIYDVSEFRFTWE